MPRIPNSAAPERDEVSRRYQTPCFVGRRGACSCSLGRSSAGEQESPLDFLDRHAAWLAGVDYGMQQRVDLAIEDRARELLHHQALEALGMARRLARAKGPAWEAMIVWSGERP